MKDEKSLRLTILHSPKNYYRDDSVQGMLEFGLNRYGYAIYSHSGDYTNGTQLGARMFNQPATAFITDMIICIAVSIFLWVLSRVKQGLPRWFQWLRL